jgi:hypothetical protein
MPNASTPAPTVRRILLALVFGAACARDATGPREEPLADICARVDAAIARFDPRFISPDDQFEAVARVVPGGFGGIAFPASGGTAIFLVQPERFEEARSVAVRAEACPNRSRLGGLGLVASANGARAGRWDYVQLRTWYTLLIDHAIGVWTMADITEDENRLTFGVADEADRAAMRDEVVRLGIPADAVDVVIFRIAFDRDRAASPAMGQTR